MKTRTILLPAAFVVPVLFSNLPNSAPAAAAKTIATPNALLRQLDAVVAGTRDTSVLLDGSTVAFRHCNGTHISQIG